MNLIKSMLPVLLVAALLTSCADSTTDTTTTTDSSSMQTTPADNTGQGMPGGAAAPMDTSAPAMDTNTMDTTNAADGTATPQ